MSHIHKNRTFKSIMEVFKGTNIFSSDFSGLPCVLQLYTRLHLSDYRQFGTLKDGSLLINIFASNELLF